MDSYLILGAIGMVGWLLLLIIGLTRKEDKDK